MPKTSLRQEITIDALPSKVWKVLTHSYFTSQYFPVENIVCHWTEGSPILFQQETNGSTERQNKGLVVEAIPGILLKYNLQDLRTTGNITTTYRLMPVLNAVQLVIYVEGFNDTNEEFLIRREQIQLLLHKIKWLAEYG